jgi:hypothetical protein
MLRILRLLHLFFFLTWSYVLFAQTKYEGFGSLTRGGKGHRVVHVSNLNATGPGSLYEAIGSNRIIVFDVAGTINRFRWDNSDFSNLVISTLTIDGSTAPSPGITLDNTGAGGNCLSFQNGCQNIIVKNLRVRNAGNDGFSLVGNCHDIVFDHVSSVNNGDGDLDITDGCYNVTVQWSIFGHSKAGAMLVAFPKTRNISIHHNLFNSTGPGAGERNPFVHNATNYQPNLITYLMADFTNNVVWNWGESSGNFGYGSGADFGGTLQVRNNFYQSTSQPENAIMKNKDSYGARVYAAGNVSGDIGVDPNSVSNVSSPWTVAPLTMEDACSAAGKVIAEAGPRPLDATDQALVDEVSLANCARGLNQLPVANAGKDVVLTLPTNTVTMNGSGIDRDGKIITYTWTKISGPRTYTIKNTNVVKPIFSNLVKGTYVFQLTVTDNKGGTATDNVTVTVKAGNTPQKK